MTLKTHEYVLMSVLNCIHETVKLYDTLVEMIKIIINQNQ